MRLLLLSDLHLELGTSFTVPEGLEFDLVLLPGDIHSPGRKAVHLAQRESTFGGKPVILVPGNHEYYHAPSHLQEFDAMREAAEGSNVHVLDRDAVVIDGVRFLGCTLWTDFLLPMRVNEVEDTNVELALRIADRALNDFRLIQVVAAMPGPTGGRVLKRRLRAHDTLAMHWVARDWLRRMLKQPFEGPTVVATHHAPGVGSVAAQYVGDALTPAFVNNLPDELFDVPVLWVHGHTHSSANYSRGVCRVVSNPPGYRRKDSSFENELFDPRLVIEVQRDPP
jgi:UDP-2,3-diacylglucosamine pyrophosphatase LpxH